MKILILTQTVNAKNPVLGFFHSWLLEFAQHFSYVTVVCLEKGEFNLPSNVEVLSLGKEEGQSRLKYFFRFYKYIWQKRQNYDVVFVHMNPVYVVLGGWVWRLLNKKIGLWYTHKHVDLKLRIATFFSDIIFSASKESFRLRTNKLLVTGHGVLKPGLQRINKECYVPVQVSVVGRISEVKQVMKVVEIFELMTQCTDAVLTIVGDALTPADIIYKKKLIDLIHQKGLKDKVIFTGALSPQAVLEMFGKTDMMLHTSKTGSIDKVVLEALLAGVIVLTENEAFKDALGEMGMYMEKNTPSDYLEKIKIFLQEEDRRKLSIKMGSEWVEKHHALTTLIPKLKKAYE